MIAERQRQVLAELNRATKYAGSVAGAVANTDWWTAPQRLRLQARALRRLSSRVEAIAADLDEAAAIAQASGRAHTIATLQRIAHSLARPFR